MAPDTTVAPETTAAPETTVAPTTTEFVGTPPTLTLVKFETQPIENGLGCGEGNRLVEVELAYTDPDGDVFQGLYVNGQGDPKASNLYEFVGDESSGTFTFTECSASGLPLTYEVLDRAGNLSNVVEGLVE